MANKKVRNLTHSGAQANAAKQVVSDFLQANADILTRTLRVYVIKAGLAKGETVPGVTDEVLQETALEALNAAHRFDVSRQPRAWLLGIAANIIKRKQVKRAIRHRHEVAIQDVRLSGDRDALSSSHESDSELFDRLAALAASQSSTEMNEHRSPSLTPRDVERDYEAKAAAVAMLAGCSAEDQTILRLAILEELDGDALAERLCVPPGTARVRLHRAIKRLRNRLEREGTKP